MKKLIFPLILSIFATCFNTFSMEKEKLPASAAQDSAANKYEELTFIDNDGTRITLGNWRYINALRQCGTIEKSEGTNGDLNFEGQNASVTGDTIIRLAEYIRNPRIIRNHTIEINKQMLVLADYLEAPENILFELANILWLDLQNKPTDNDAEKDEKNTLRMIAEPYLQSPAYLLKIMGRQCIRNTFHRFFIDDNQLNLSYSMLIESSFGYQWITAEDGLLYDTYHPFCSLKGLKELLAIAYLAKVNQIDLSGHRLTAFSLHDIQGNFNIINLSHNLITNLDAEQFDGQLPMCIDLRHNRISHVDENIYSLAWQWRNLGKHVYIDLRDNLLTEKQKKYIQKKWDIAVTTLPERIYKPIEKFAYHPFTTLMAHTLVAGTVCGLTVHNQLNNSSRLLRYPMVTTSALLGALAGIGLDVAYTQTELWTPLIGAGVGGYLGTHLITKALQELPWYARISIASTALPTTCTLGAAAFWILARIPKGKAYISSLAAKMSHPNIKFGDYDAVWYAYNTPGIGL